MQNKDIRPYSTLGIRNRTLMESYGLLESYIKPVSGMQAQIKKALEVGEGYNARTCYNFDDRKEIRKVMEEEIREGKYTIKLFDEIDKSYKNVVQNIKSFYITDLKLISNEKLIEYFNIYYQIYITTLHPMVLAIYASDLHDIFETELKKVLKENEKTLGKILDYTALLLTPSRLTTVQKEEQRLFDLQDEFETQFSTGTEEEFKKFANQPKTKQAFQNLADSYGWFHMEYIGEVRTVKDYQDQLWARIKELKEAKVDWESQKSPNSRLKEIIEGQERFFKEHQNSIFLKQLVFAMQEFLIVLDFSKADLIEGIFYARALLTEISERLGLNSWIDVRYLLPSEIISFLRESGKTNVDFLKERKQNFTLVLENNQINNYFGQAAVKMANDLLERETAENVKEFKGLTAYPGKVRGVACVVTSANDRAKFKKGSILVTRDTTTELTSIIKGSIAIVADQGSLLSHTAIVSREFKIPCLVLTKIGTQVVKDGDELEVDASNGIVKILN